MLAHSKSPHLLTMAFATFCLIIINILHTFIINIADTTAKNPAILTPPTIRQSPVSQSEESGSKIKATSSDSSLNKLGLKSQGDDVSIKSSSSTSSLLNLANYPIPSSTNLLR